MIVAHIKNNTGDFVGTINHENSGFRIAWKERKKNPPGNIHTIDSELYPTIKEARQAVYKALENAQIIKA